MVEPKIQAKENQNANSNGLRQSPVEVHGLVDPVTITQVPHKAADIPQSRALTCSKCISYLVFTQQCSQKRQKSDPAKSSTPKRRGSRDGKGQNLQHAGDYSHSPEPHGNSSHRSRSLTLGYLSRATSEIQSCRDGFCHTSNC